MLSMPQLYWHIYMIFFFLFLQQAFIKHLWSSLLVFSFINEIIDNLPTVEIR